MASEELTAKLRGIARAHTNPYQHGARRVDVYRLLPGRFAAGTPGGRERVAGALATLVEDGVVEAVEVDGTVYYRLVE